MKTFLPLDNLEFELDKIFLLLQHNAYEEALEGLTTLETQLLHETQSNEPEARTNLRYILQYITSVREANDFQRDVLLLRLLTFANQHDLGKYARPEYLPLYELLGLLQSEHPTPKKTFNIHYYAAQLHVDSRLICYKLNYVHAVLFLDTEAIGDALNGYAQVIGGLLPAIVNKSNYVTALHQLYTATAPIQEIDWAVKTENSYQQANQFIWYTLLEKLKIGRKQGEKILPQVEAAVADLPKGALQAWYMACQEWLVNFTIKQIPTPFPSQNALSRSVLSVSQRVAVSELTLVVQHLLEMHEPIKKRERPVLRVHKGSA